MDYQKEYKRQMKQGNKVGWSHATKDSMVAAGADMLSKYVCMQPYQVYEWAVKNNIALDDSKVLHSHCTNAYETSNAIMDCVWGDN